jgi:hypothetical protein
LFTNEGFPRPKRSQPEARFVLLPGVMCGAVVRLARSRLGQIVFAGLSAGLAALLDAHRALGDSTPMVEAGTRLVPIFLTAEDESRHLVAWFDTVRAEECSYAVSGDGAIRCLPTHLAEARFFSDEACSRPIAAISSCSTPRYLVVIVPNPAQCGAGARHYLHEPGAKVRPAAIYARQAGGCVRAPLDPSLVYLEVAGSVPPSAFVAARPVTRRSGLSLKTAYSAPSWQAGGP